MSVASTPIQPCTGCDQCRDEADEPIHVFQEGDPLLPCETVVESGALFHPCVIDDDMNEVRKHLDAADELIVVCPVYFAGVPAQMKALLDRLQPYYYTDLRTRPKRPAVIHVVGAGGHPALGPVGRGLHRGAGTRLGGEDPRQRRDHRRS